MRFPSLPALLGVWLLAAAAQAGPAPASGAAKLAVPSEANVLSTLDPHHPRLFLKEDSLRQLKEALGRPGADPAFDKCFQGLLAKAEKIQAEPPPQYRKSGRIQAITRVSRNCVTRIYVLALAYRLTGKESYAAKARDVMLAACAFPDWNPKSFLDTAEMTNAVGVGYDWLFDYLAAASRETIKASLIEKGLEPGVAAYTGPKPASWVKNAFNWNQVCNSGLIIGALAVADTDPQYARIIIPHAVQSLPVALASYAPDGAWPEGPGYWWYATRYTVFALAALEWALGTDFGLSDLPGLAQAGFTPIYMIGPSGYYLNYADTGPNRREPLGDMFWLARRYQQPAFAADEHACLAHHPADPEHLIWYQPPVAMPPLALDKRFGGKVEAAFMRSAWNDPTALWVGVKAGYNQVNHGHLDLGNFELDALGARWALDLGGDSYDLPRYFSKEPTAPRWTYYRCSSLSHNVPLLDNQNQDVFATSRIDKFQSRPDAAFAILDLTSAYKDKSSKTTRGVALIDVRRAALVQDEFQITAPCEAAWGMTTKAEIAVDRDGSALLTMEDKQMRARLLSPAGAAFTVESAEQRPPPHKSNKGVRRLMARVPAQPGPLRIAVLLAPVWPAGGEAPAPALRPLADWN
ncbi:MAG: heparinase II/III family protein [Candidatus Sumerlaeota bacterium]|nr:heparinase II/III family protein [Candidatus Sumerlaeota bacterium]